MIQIKIVGNDYSEENTTSLNEFIPPSAGEGWNGLINYINHLKRKGEIHSAILTFNQRDSLRRLRELIALTPVQRNNLLEQNIILLVFPLMFSKLYSLLEDSISTMEFLSQCTVSTTLSCSQLRAACVNREQKICSAIANLLSDDEKRGCLQKDETRSNLAIISNHLHWVFQKLANRFSLCSAGLAISILTIMGLLWLPRYIYALGIGVVFVLLLSFAITLVLLWKCREGASRLKKTYLIFIMIIVTLLLFYTLAGPTNKMNFGPFVLSTRHPAWLFAGQEAKLHVSLSYIGNKSKVDPLDFELEAVQSSSMKSSVEFGDNSALTYCLRFNSFEADETETETVDIKALSGRGWGVTKIIIMKNCGMAPNKKNRQKANEINILIFSIPYYLITVFGTIIILLLPLYETISKVYE